MKHTNSRMLFMHHTGFSLIELMTVLAIVGILAAIAVPTYQGMRTNSIVRGAARKIYGDFNWTKAQAIKTGTTHVVEYGLTIGGTLYDYVVWQDTNTNSAYDAGEEVRTVLLNQEGLYGVTLVTPANSAFFDGRGMLLNPGNGTIVLQKAGYTGTLSIVISPLGKVEIQ